MIRTVSSARNLPPRSLSYPLRNIDPWVRNAEWPALPQLADGDQKLVGLYAVFDTASEFLAVQASGNYTVDWGDGTSDNVNSGVKADHQYTYSSISGSPISLGYKIVTVTITPQSGQNLTSVYLNKRHSTQTAAGSSGWLDVAINSPNITVINIGGSASNSTLLVRHGMLEQVSIRQHAVTNMSYMLQSCYVLASVLISDTSSVTSMASMFYNCSSLVFAPRLNTVLVSNMSNMFQSCYSLVSAPRMDTSAVTNMSYMFHSCYSLSYVPVYNTGIVTSMSNMFQNCYVLRSAPAFNTAAVTSMANMFQNCYSLIYVPAFNTSALTNAASMFNSCISLSLIPAIDMSAISSPTNSASMFASCSALSRMLGTGLKYAVDFTGGNLTATALNEIFTNLGAASGAQTVTVKTNPGAATCTKSIAEAKGWTVTIA